MHTTDPSIPVLTDRVAAARGGRFVPVDPARNAPGDSRLLESLRRLLGPRGCSPCCS